MLHIKMKFNNFSSISKVIINFLEIVLFIFIPRNLKKPFRNISFIMKNSNYYKKAHNLLTKKEMSFKTNKKVFSFLKQNIWLENLVPKIIRKLSEKTIKNITEITKKACLHKKSIKIYKSIKKYDNESLEYIILQAFLCFSVLLELPMLRPYRALSLGWKNHKEIETKAFSLKNYSQRSFSFRCRWKSIESTKIP